jgi:hypothetical protein
MDRWQYLLEHTAYQDLSYTGLLDLDGHRLRVHDLVDGWLMVTAILMRWERQHTRAAGESDA